MVLQADPEAEYIESRWQVDGEMFAAETLTIDGVRWRADGTGRWMLAEPGPRLTFPLESDQVFRAFFAVEAPVMQIDRNETVGYRIELGTEEGNVFRQDEGDVMAQYRALDASIVADPSGVIVHYRMSATSQVRRHGSGEIAVFDYTTEAFAELGVGPVLTAPVVGGP